MSFKIKFCIDAYFYMTICLEMNLNLDRATLSVCWVSVEHMG